MTKFSATIYIQFGQDVHLGPTDTRDAAAALAAAWLATCGARLRASESVTDVRIESVQTESMRR